MNNLRWICSDIYQCKLLTVGDVAPDSHDLASVEAMVIFKINDRANVRYNFIQSQLPTTFRSAGCTSLPQSAPR
ncbi:hypothetical protein [Glaciimonas sp. PAMC28666]|uniref:hypothetical protein n=1 Tax=Glaciimonas sp. PAMC28666 TaxID=2807626 RepID=UPI0019632847|nr:hypothetical protein [Glaciimonas sp. PAMC28666]QRX80817.1 hypothetical protein JQN73_11280 [Glaciimonas sp. PAMC28666]